jgi:hypothetical protein
MASCKDMNRGHGNVVHKSNLYRFSNVVLSSTWDRIFLISRNGQEVRDQLYEL